MHHQENQNWLFSAIFANIILITTGKPNKLQKIQNHLEKAENFSFLQMVMDLLQLIGFTHGDQKKIAKNGRKSQKIKLKKKLAIFDNFLLIAMGEPNKLQKIHNHLEKAEVLSFLWMVVYFLQLIGFACGDQNNIGKNCQKSPILIFLMMHFFGTSCR